MKKRIISLLLATMLLVGVMSVSAFAAGELFATDGVTGTMELTAPAEAIAVGDTFEVVVGITAEQAVAISLEFGYPAEAMTLDSVALVNGVPGGFPVAEGNHYWWLGCYSDGDIEVDDELKFDLAGDFLKLTFTAKAAAEDAEITVKAEGGSYDDVEYRINIAAQTAVVNIKAADVEKTVVLLGDVNDDGKVNGKDATLIAKASSGIETLSDLQKVAANVNGDTRVNGKDATIVAKYSAKIDVDPADGVLDMMADYGVGTEIEVG